MEAGGLQAAQENLARLGGRDWVEMPMILFYNFEIEEVVELILEASSREAAADQLKSDYGLSEIQALGILDMPLEQLTVDGLEALELEYRSYVN